MSGNIMQCPAISKRLDACEPCRGLPGCKIKYDFREDEKTTAEGAIREAQDNLNEAYKKKAEAKSAYEELRRRMQAQREDLGDTAARGVLYRVLREVLDDAFRQASAGKGEERHGRGLPFEKQPILELARMLGSIDGQLQQVMKKSQEASHMAKRGEKDKAETELLGAIVYAAAAVRILREQD